ncbi:MAG: hypothetical protein ACI870_000210 [Crocinitomicaceae bacterium]|jgi:hypothetical protein
MKKYLKYIPHIAFAVLIIGFGAIGKLTGAAPAVEMFEAINLFGLGEQFGRIMVGLGQLFAGIGIFFVLTRKSSAVLGMAIMAGAVYFHLTIFGGSPALAIITFILAVYLLLTSKCCGKKGTCESGTCSA